MPYVPKTDWQYNDVLSEQDMNRIEGGIAEVKQLSAAHVTALQGAHRARAITLDDEQSRFAATNVEAALEEIGDELSTKRMEKFNKDANGYFTRVEYRRSDDSLYLRTELMNPDANGNYQTQLLTYFQADGTTVKRIEERTISYDADGELYKYE